ncbi:MAG: helix-turn-helix domain-containing protein [Veillonellales bacterium]
MASFSERLRELRERKDVKQKEVGAVIGVSESSIGKYESGDRTPDPDALIKLADYFEVTLDDLLGRKIPKGIITKDDPNPEISHLLRDNGIKKLELAKDVTLEELKMGIELVKTIRKEHGYDK